jgi:hypothetical protein
VKREKIFHGRKPENEISRKDDRGAKEFADIAASTGHHAAQSLLFFNFAVQFSA